MPYHNPKPAETQRTAGRPEKGRVKWNLTMNPEVKEAIIRAARRRQQTPSDYLNAHFADLAAAEQQAQQSQQSPQ